MKSYLDNDFIALVDDALDNGSARAGRNGVATSVFGRMLRHDMRNGFPLITTRRIYTRGVIGELTGFIRGYTSLAQFKELGCNYWDLNAEQWGRGDNLGRIYGVQWRDWNGTHDQLKALVHGIKSNPFGRRHLLTTWNPGELEDMCLPPCHLLNQYFVGRDGSLSCTVYMRSVDLCLGLPSDLVLYGLMLQLVARETLLWPKDLVFMLGDAHVYENHEDLWAIQRVRKPAPSVPVLKLSDDASLFGFKPEHATIAGYNPHEAISYALN